MKCDNFIGIWKTVYALIVLKEPNPKEKVCFFPEVCTSQGGKGKNSDHHSVFFKRDHPKIIGSGEKRIIKHESIVIVVDAILDKKGKAAHIQEVVLESITCQYRGISAHRINGESRSIGALGRSDGQEVSSYESPAGA